MNEKKYGPNTAEVDAYLAILPKLTGEQWTAAWEVTLAAARDDAWDVARVAAWDAALVAGRVAVREAALIAVRVSAWDAARTAAWAAVALVTRDLITPEQFDTLTAPMRAAGIDFDALTTGSADPVRCPKCGGPHPFHDPACVVHPDLIQDHTDGSEL